VKDQLKDYITGARWFGGKGRQFDVVDVRRLRLPSSADPTTTAPLGLVTVELVTLRYDTGETDVYQVPVSYYLGQRAKLQHALIGAWDDEELGHIWAYDALHDHAATPLWLNGFIDGTQVGDLRFHRIGDQELDRQSRSTILSAEQSNTSVAFGDESLMKLFRRVTPGVNPDIEILTALTEAGNEHVASLYGWVEGPPGEEVDEVLQLGILQQFLRTASDGWGLALVSLRDLFAADVDDPAQAGGDFAAEAHRLGGAVADMHVSLRSAFPTETWDRTRLAELADAMSRRLDAAVEVVPGIEPYSGALHSLFDAVRHLTRPVTVHRVHGDLHLGQTLRTVKNWKIIDFEGEPAKPLAERRRPDSPWRDVAGMLRSFDYAAELARKDHSDATGDVGEHDEELARRWSSRNVEAFLTGYKEADGSDIDQMLTTAYAADKAVYEAVYEARNRPDWLPIPLGALARLTTAARGDGFLGRRAESDARPTER
jgi:maltokinase